MSRARPVAYSTGALGAALSYQCFSTYVQFFYIDILGLAASWVGAAMVIYGIWNAFNDPLAGQVSDRTRTRWGRRVPYIAFGSLPLAVCFAIVWAPPFQAEQRHALWLFLYFLVAILLFDTLWTFVSLNWTALFPEMFPDLRQRAEVSGWRQFFAVPGLILGIALPPLIYSSLGWSWMGIIFSLITGIFLYISLWGSQERLDLQQDQPMAFRQALRASLAIRSFRLFMVANFCIQFTFVMLTATLPFYSKYVLGLGDVQTSTMLGAAFVTALPFLYVWTKVAQRLGSQRALLVALALFGIALLAFLVIADFPGAIATMMGTGVGLAGLLMLPDLLIADIIDEDELNTGRRREGMFFGMNGFIIRFAVSMQSLLLSQTLRLSGYLADLPSQSTSVLLSLRLLISAVPIVALAIAFLATRSYPLHGDRLTRMKAQLARSGEQEIEAREPS